MEVFRPVETGHDAGAAVRVGQHEADGHLWTNPETLISFHSFDPIQLQLDSSIKLEFIMSSNLVPIHA